MGCGSLESNLATEKNNIWINGTLYSNKASSQYESWVGYTHSRIAFSPDVNKPVIFGNWEFGSSYAIESIDFSK